MQTLRELSKTAILSKISFRGKEKNYVVVDLGFPRFSEVDFYQVVWNGHYVNYFETARLELCRSFDVELSKISEWGCYLPVHNYEVNVTRPVFLKDRMHVAARLDGFSQGILDFSHLLLVDGRIRAHGKVKHVLVDSKTLEILSEPPELVRASFDRMSELFFSS